jgi:hypothetical protein
MVAWAGVSVEWLLRLLVRAVNLPERIPLQGMNYCTDFYGIQPPMNVEGAGLRQRGRIALAGLVVFD